MRHQLNPFSFSVLIICLLFFFQQATGNEFRKNDTSILFTPVSRTIHLPIGDTYIPVKVASYGTDTSIVFFNMHADEISSLQAGKSILEKHGGLLINIENNRQRNISFKLNGKKYTFDPNRMFTAEGAEQTLSHFGKVSQAAIKEVHGLGLAILHLMPQNLEYLVALHNNTDGAFSIHSYTNKGERKKDAKKVFVNDKEDPDNIFLTTDSLLYEHLAQKKFNTILQDEEEVKQDGSLSVYSSNNNIRYLNCETEHGQRTEYIEMMEAAMEYICRVSRYNEYSLYINDTISPLEEKEIIFNGEVVGHIIKTQVKEGKTIGSLLLKKHFRPSTNMFFFYIQNTNGSSSLEIRILPEIEDRPVTANSQIEVISIPIIDEEFYRKG